MASAFGLAINAPVGLHEGLDLGQLLKPLQVVHKVGVGFDRFRREGLKGAAD